MNKLFKKRNLEEVEAKLARLEEEVGNIEPAFFPDGRQGYVGESGKLVIAFHSWQEVWPFQEGLAPIEIADRFGFIDKSGEVIIPCVWRSVSGFNEGLSRVEDDRGLEGVINKCGDIVIPCQWNHIGSFNDGLAVVNDANNKWGYINRQGEVVVPCKWSQAVGFEKGYAKVKGDNNLYGVIDTNGNEVVPCQWEGLEILLPEI